MMNWDDFRIFAELARCGSLSETARSLRVDHTTVARRVSALEEALGLRLFDRLPRGYVLTPEGAGVVERMGSLEDAVFAIERYARGQGSALAGMVRISAPPFLASHLIAPRLKPFHDAHPGVEIELVGEVAAARLSRHEADIAVRLSRPAESGLVARKAGTLAYGLYGARDYVAATAAEDLAFCGYDPSLAHVPQQRWLAARAGGKPFVFRSNDLGSLYAAVLAGFGLAALPHFLGHADPRLLCLEDAPPAAREIWLAVHPDLRRAPRVRAMLDHLGALFADLPLVASRPENAPGGA